MIAKEVLFSILRQSHFTFYFFPGYPPLFSKSDDNRHEKKNFILSGNPSGQGTQTVQTGPGPNYPEQTQYRIEEKKRPASQGENLRDS